MMKLLVALSNLGASAVCAAVLYGVVYHITDSDVDELLLTAYAVVFFIALFIVMHHYTNEFIGEDD